MARILVHLGTGTIIDLDDDCWILEGDYDTDEVEQLLTEYSDSEKSVLELLTNHPFVAPEEHQFSYHLSDLVNDLEEGTGDIAPENRAFLSARDEVERISLIQSTFEALVEDQRVWSVWWDTFNRVVAMAKRGYESGNEPF